MTAFNNVIIKISHDDKTLSQIRKEMNFEI